MRAVKNAQKRLIIETAEKFLEEHTEDVLSNTLWWAENMHTTLEEALDKVCFAQMMERGEGERLLRRVFGDLSFLDMAEEIVQDFGYENAVSLAKKRGVLNSETPNRTKNLAAVIVYENLPDCVKIAKHAAKEMKKRDEWKKLVQKSEEVSA